MARGKRTDPAAAVLAKVMHQMGFEVRLICTASGLPRATVKDITEGNGSWRQMPDTDLFQITRVRLLRMLDESLYELGMDAIARLEQKMKTASFNELIGIMDVAVKRGDSPR